MQKRLNSPINPIWVLAEYPLLQDIDREKITYKSFPKYNNSVKKTSYPITLFRHLKIGMHGSQGTKTIFR